MPRRTDLNSVLVIGSGPIVIGQACEFDAFCALMERAGAERGGGKNRAGARHGQA